MTSSLEVSGVTVKWGRAVAVDDVSFAVAPGETVAILGRNGAGKSSLLAGIAGLVTRAAGEVRVDARSMPPGRSTAKAGLAIVLERRELFAHVSVEDNLILGAYTRGQGLRSVRTGDTIEAVYSQFPKLRERRRQLAGTLSGGEQQMLAIGRAMMSSPKILVLDEPSIGLAPIIVDQIYERLSALKADGLTIVLVEEHPRRAMILADSVLILERGRVEHRVSGESLRADPGMLEATYLARPQRGQSNR